MAFKTNLAQPFKALCAMMHRISALDDRVTLIEQNGVGGGGDGETTVVNGVSPTISVETITGGHRLTITDINGTKTIDVMNGQDGQDGQDGKDGTNATTPTSIDWSNITGVPSAFTPAAHTHSYDSLTGEPTYLYDPATESLYITTTNTAAG